MDQVQTFYKISQILSQAFKEVNDVCAHFMADQSIENIHSKPVEKKVQEKPKEKSVPVQEPQQKKETKVQQKKETKAPVAQKQNNKPAQQKKQTQPKQNENKNKTGNPQKPKQPLSAFFIFQQQQKENVKKLHPNSGITDISKMMGQIWRGLQESEKAPYINKSEQLKKQYEKQLKHFYEKHPEQKSKKQLKKEKAQSKKQEEVNEAPAQSAPASKSSRKPIVIEQENSESV